MEVEEYINKMKKVQNNILDFINDEDDDNFLFEDLKQLFEDLNIFEDSLTLKSLLILIHKITYNHHFTTNQILKIQKIFQYLQNSINHMISNQELYHIFDNNIRMLIILIEEKILENDESYFQISEYYLNPKNITKDKDKNAQNNEEKINLQFKLINNHNYIYQLIENDSIKEFIIYVNQTNLSLHSTHIKISIYEKNIFLRNKSPTLIELAAFYGSIQIFQYLRFNSVELTPSLWVYTIHSQNTELIHLLEENNIDPPNNSFLNCYLEAIECHHNSIAEYIHDNLLNEKIDTNSEDYIVKVMKSHNYNYFPSDLKHIYIPYYLCEYNYSKLVEISLEIKFYELKTYMYRIPFLFFFVQFLLVYLNSVLKLFGGFNSYYRLAPLHCAVKYNHTDIVNIILNRPGVSIFQHYFFGNNELKEICLGQYIESIEYEAFRSCYSLKEIIIPNSVKIIEYQAFSDCYGLEKVVLSNSLEVIEYQTFYCCTSLKEIRIPSSVIEIGRCAFENCSSLENVYFESPSSLKAICTHAFIGCDKLEKIDFPSSLIGLGLGCFEGCFLKTVEFPSSLKFIGSFTFSGCKFLKKIVILSSIQGISNNAFEDCSMLEEVIFQPDSSLKFIDCCLFYHCYSLSRIVIPSSVKTIEDHAFECVPLKEIVFPSSIERLGNYTFCRCESLTKIVIPSSLKMIGEGCFEKCTKVEEIIFESPSSLSEIEENLFNQCISLKRIDIPSSVTTIKYSAFYQCSSLKDVIIPSSVTVIGDLAFKQCTSLNNIPIPSSVRTINQQAFRECISLTQIIIPSSVISIGYAAFEGCKNLQNIYIHHDVFANNIDKSAFENCFPFTRIKKI